MKGGACKSERAAVEPFIPPTDLHYKSVHFSSKTFEWPTPQWLFDLLDEEFGFTLDPCSTDVNAKCDKHFTLVDDGLAQTWKDETVFMNPPYGRDIGRWMEKAYREASEGATVVCLVPARTDTAWWHDWAMNGEIRLFRGRITFEGATTGAPFPSALVVFRPRTFEVCGSPEIGGRTRNRIIGFDPRVPPLRSFRRDNERTTSQ